MIVSATLVITLGTDLYLYQAGKSWTPLQYESMLPLLLVGQRRRLLTQATLALMLLLSTKLAYFEFGLTLDLIAESALATMALGLGTVVLLGLLALGWRHLAIGLGACALAVGSTYAVDKVSMRDMLVSAHLPQQAKWNRVPIRSTNALYPQLRDRLARGQGAVLIVWESLGWPLDERALQAFGRAFPQATLTRLPYEGGSTLSAEMRFLCNSIRGVLDHADCLPRSAAAAAYHGNTLAYFNRRDVYPKLGFNESFGRVELAGLPLCHYGFNAVCDSALIDRVVDDTIASECRGLHYALTIDSHFPYLKYDDHVAGLMNDVQAALARLAQLKTRYPDCAIFVVGDHPPPMARAFASDATLLISM